jgi:uncharacterized membrane protein
MRSPFPWLIKSFLKGLLLVVPLSVTVWVVVIIFRKIDGLLSLHVPGLGFLLTIVFILMVGVLGSNILVTRSVAYLERLLNRLPLVKLIYFSLKDLIGAFVGEKKSFKFPVLVSLQPGSDAKVLGFVTAESLDLPGAQDHMAVYLPQSYNYSGFMILVPKDRVTALPQGDSAKWLAFIVSGGVSRGREGEGLIGGEDFSTGKFPKV